MTETDKSAPITKDQYARRLREVADNLSRRGDIDPEILRDLRAAADGMDVVAEKMPDEQPKSTEVPHPSFFIQEEMEARGWDRWDLARRMGGDPQLRRMELDLYFGLGPEKTNMRLGETGDDIAAAFDVSREFLQNMEAAWLRSQGIKP